MKVRCIDNLIGDYKLIIDKVYDVLDVRECCYNIRNERGSKIWYYKDFFEVVEEFKEYRREESNLDKVVEQLESVNTESHYKGVDSLYKFCEQWKLNAYEFDIIKRVVRCRHKGNFEDDLRKTKNVIDIYLKEYGSKLG